MARQHFYSCVPAKMSLFNKMDGFDTFAHSEGITREQMETELAAVYNNKPTKEDAALVATDALPPVYSQFTLSDGTLAQSTVSFIRSDYTGERSGYLVHSLLLDEKEYAAHMNDPANAPFNPAVFTTDISKFKLTSPDAKGDPEYRKKTVPALPAGDPKELADTYDTGMLKRLIYALIGIPCGKTKTVYLSLPVPVKDFSAACLDFLNRILQIFPYHMRPAMSFVTYVGDHTKFPGFKIRCIAENAPALPTAKGVAIKMGQKDFSGLSDQNVTANADVVEFFYALLSDGEMRREFIAFCQHAVEAVPALEKVTLKNLTDLVFLFRVLCGRFPEKNVMPNDDAVYAFMTVYDKNRDALTEEYRSRAADCLRRYPESQTAIPKNVFTKVGNLYPDEPEGFRRTVMEVALELIHTDVMREKLFGFIKANYDSETPETRATVMKDLCRVYYGGFLQEPILEFITGHFENEPADIRDTILERLLLTVRTPKVQGMVLSFIDTFYDGFSAAEKERFYAVFYEMLPEGDTLSRAMADVVDKHIEDDRKAEVTAHILEAVEQNEKRHEHTVCEALATACGFTESVLAEKVLTDWSGRKVLEAFLPAVAKRAPMQVVDTVRELYTAAPDMKPELAEQVFSAFAGAFAAGRYGAFALIGAADAMNDLKAELPATAAFADRWQKEVMLPAIDAALPAVLDVKKYPDGVEHITALAAERPEIAQCAGYAPIAAAEELIRTAKAGEGAAMFPVIERLEGDALRKNAAVLLKNATAGEDAPAGDMCFWLALADGTLTAGEWAFDTAAGALREEKTKEIRARGGNEKPEVLSRIADEETLTAVLGMAGALYGVLPAERQAAVIDAEGNLAKYIRAFMTKYDKKGKKFVSAQAETLPASPEAFAAFVRGLPETQKESGGLFARLFKK